MGWVASFRAGPIEKPKFPFAENSIVVDDAHIPVPFTLALKPYVGLALLPCGPPNVLVITTGLVEVPATAGAVKLAVPLVDPPSRRTPPAVPAAPTCKALLLTTGFVKVPATAGAVSLAVPLVDPPRES